MRIQPPAGAGDRLRLVLACDAFRGCLTAHEVVDALAAGLRRKHDVTTIPVADGGEGTLAAALSAGWTAIPVTACGPAGEPVGTAVARSPDGDTALVELADACGIGRLPDGRRAPMTASSRGLGEALGAALDLGVRRLVVAVGGSASTDGGAGMLAALGVRTQGVDGAVLPDGGGALADAARVDVSDVDPRLFRTEIVLASDVDAPLLGATGAATVFAPQKGATPGQVAALEAGLSRWARLLDPAGGSVTAAGAGAGGGVGFALRHVLGAQVQPGIDLVLDLVGFDAALTGADLVVTGEGSLDTQSLAGKAPVGVARRAAAHGVPTVAVCGRSQLRPDQAADAGFADVLTLVERAEDEHASMAQAASLLTETATDLAGRLSRGWRPG